EREGVGNLLRQPREERVSIQCAALPGIEKRLLGAGDALQPQHDAATPAAGMAEEFPEEPLGMRERVVVPDEEDVRVEGFGEHRLARAHLRGGCRPAAVALL